MDSDGEAGFPPEMVALDTVLDALSNKYRRRLLVALLEHNPQDDDDTQIPADVAIEDEDTEQLEIAIKHSHLPKLEGAGFIEWDKEKNVIRKGPKFAEIQPLLELMHNHAEELPDEWI